MSNAVQKPEISTLSLARRAGKLILGFDKVAEAMRGGEVRGVFYSTDLSKKAARSCALPLRSIRWSRCRWQ